MRIAPLAVVILLLSVPASSALLPTAPSAPALGLPGPRDGDIILLMAQHTGLHPTRLAIPTPALGDSVPALVARLAERAGHPAPTHAELAGFAALDPRLAAPVLTLLVAIEQAWILRDQAFDGPETKILTPVEEEMLVAAAIMLLDTADAIVIPQLQALADEPVWPPIAIADPVGILRIGSAGDDVDTLPRAVSIDGRGNDQYRNSIAYAIPVDFNVNTVETPVAFAIDLQGNDYYEQVVRTRGHVGFASRGIAAFYDLDGDDEYTCDTTCFGSVVNGIAVARDVKGDDVHDAGSFAYGSAAGDIGGLGLAREDAGDDRYLLAGTTAGSGSTTGFGLFWDRAGEDSYTAYFDTSALFGWARGASHGWHVDDGPESDTYWIRQDNSPFGKGRCHGCIWSSGVDNPPDHGGRGNNGMGGLPYLFAYQDTH
jgi:hypothetical protein